jgi:Ser-tRNA(Ala) deacylase AlaX
MMSFLVCQQDAYQREAEVEILSCTPQGEHFVALVENSILYPEGGGQPADRGSIAGVEVLDVQKTGSSAQVTVTLKREVQAGVRRAVVDWKRRYDLMQQHSAQHLITAIAADVYQANTVSFHLGEEYAAIELDVPQLPDHKLKGLLHDVNEAIRANLAIRWKSVSVDEYDSLNVRSRGLPKGHIGDVRLVEIEGLDLNTCGGTHVASTGELQAVVFLGVEKLRGQVRLSYLAGGRVLKRFSEQLQREKELSSLLSCPSEQFAEMLVKQQNEAKQLRRVQRSLLQELAEGLGKRLAESDEAIVYEHRDAGDLGFLNSVVKAALSQNPEKRLFLTHSDASRGSGLFLLAGPPEWVKAAGAIAAEVMEGRGGGKPGRYQGKVQAVEKRVGALQAMQEALES